MKITSKEFENNARIPEKFTADGQNINPELKITKIPENAKVLVLIVDDPDAERVCGYTWIHWIQFNIKIDGEELTIEEDSLPGTSGDSTYHKEKYGGPNPPAGSGEHHYRFKVFALLENLELEPMSKLNAIHNKMKDTLIEKAELVGTYSRG